MLQGDSRVLRCRALRPRHYSCGCPWWGPDALVRGRAVPSGYRAALTYRGLQRCVQDASARRRRGSGERGAQPAAGRPVRRGGGGGRAARHGGDRPVHRALVRPRRALVLRVGAGLGAHGAVQCVGRFAVRGVRVVAGDRVLRRSRSDRNCGPVGIQRRGHRRRSGSPGRDGPHVGREGLGDLAARVGATPSSFLFTSALWCGASVCGVLPRGRDLPGWCRRRT